MEVRSLHTSAPDPRVAPLSLTVSDSMLTVACRASYHPAFGYPSLLPTPLVTLATPAICLPGLQAHALGTPCGGRLTHTAGRAHCLLHTFTQRLLCGEVFFGQLIIF